MVDKATLRIINIKSYTHGADRYKGILDISVTKIMPGALRFKKDEGEFYPTGTDRLGVAEPPVEFQVRAESLEYLLTLLNAAAADVVVVGDADGASADKTFTFNNVQYESSSGQLQRDRDGAFTITGKCYSTDGAALPFSIA